jgi:hypothetical protein
LVETSKAAIAAVRSEISFVVRAAPPLVRFVEVPDDRDDLLVFDRTFGSISDRTGPAADGGGFDDDVGIGDWAREDPDDPGVKD